MIHLAGLALSLWGLWWPEPYLLCVAALAIAPVVGVLLFTISDELAGDAVTLVLMPLLALWLRALDFPMIDWAPACLVAAMATVVAITGMALARSDRAVAMLVGAASALWAWSVVIEANVLAAPGSTTFVRTEVVDKRDTRSSNYLTLKPPLYRSVPREVDVGWRLYGAVQPGDEVCVRVHRGAFGWRWWDVNFCP